MRIQKKGNDDQQNLRNGFVFPDADGPYGPAYFHAQSNVSTFLRSSVENDDGFDLSRESRRRQRRAQFAAASRYTPYEPVRARTKKNQFDHLKPITSYGEFFSLTAKGFLIAHGFFYAAYAFLFLANFYCLIMLSPVVIPFFLFTWNYFSSFSNSVAHVNNFLEISTSPRDRQRKLFLEAINAMSTLTLAVGTTLSFLSKLHFTYGILAIVSAPLVTVMPAVISLVKGLIEFSHACTAYKRLSLSAMYRDRNKHKERIGDWLKNNALLKPHEREYLKQEYEAYSQQKDIIKKVMDYRENPSLSKQPSSLELQLVDFLELQQYETFRNHAFNAVFWFFVGAGFCLVSFPPALVPGVILIGLGSTIKLAGMLEVDKRIYNCFVVPEKQKRITGSNEVTNYLSYWKKENEIYNQYYPKYDEASRQYVISPDMKIVRSVVEKSGCWFIQDKEQAQMKIAYQVTRNRFKGEVVNEQEFYRNLLKISRWERRKVLKRAMQLHLEGEALKECPFPKKLHQSNRTFCLEAWTRGYSLFSDNQSSSRQTTTSNRFAHQNKMLPSAFS